MSISRFQAPGVPHAKQPTRPFGHQTEKRTLASQSESRPENTKSERSPAGLSKSSRGKSSRLRRILRPLSHLAFGTFLVAGCFHDGSPRSSDNRPIVSVQELQLSTVKGLEADRFPFSPLEPPFHLTLPGTKGLSSKHLVLIVNTNRGENNRLGLYQPKGLTKAHLQNALNRTTHPEVQTSLNQFLDHFDMFDADQNGTITLKDIQQYVHQQYHWTHRPFFSKAEAQNQAEFYLAQQFGIQE